MRRYLAWVAILFCACRSVGSLSTRPLPVSVEINSLRWNTLTIVNVREGTLAMPHDPPDGFERVTVTDPQFLRDFAARYETLRVQPGDKPEDGDYRILARASYPDGTMASLAIDIGCDFMSRSGKSCAFDRKLFELVVSRLSAGHRRALGGKCRLKEAR